MPVRPLDSAGRMAAGGLMLALWLATSVISISPGLHELLHNGSQSGKHECLVTSFTNGQVLSGASVGVVPVVDSGCLLTPPPVVVAFVSQPANRFSASRAPPAPLPIRQG